MLIKQLNRDEAETVYVSVQNVAGAKVSVGQMLCYDWQATSSFGNAVTKPAVSNTTLFAGVVTGGTDDNPSDIADDAYGLLMASGPCTSVAYNVATTSVSAAGLWLLPIAAQYSGINTQISGKALSVVSESYYLNKGAIVLENDLSASGFTAAFVRAL